MPTYTALTTLPDKARADALGLALEALDPAPTGVGVFGIEDGSGEWEVGGYFTDPPDDVALALLAAAHGAAPFALSELPETDWVAHVKRELRPVEAGRFFVYGSHAAGALPDDRVGLLIEAAMAFGTGHHGTTQGCLEALDALARAEEPVGRVIDVGCGTAVLAMAAARVWRDARIVAGDIDPVAVDVARANLAANDLAGRIACVTAAGLDHPDFAEYRPADLIFANILKGPLIALAPDIISALAPGGHVILSGLLTEQAAEVSAAYQARGLVETFRLVRGDWATLTLNAPGAG